MTETFGDLVIGIYWRLGICEWPAVTDFSRGKDEFKITSISLPYDVRSLVFYQGHDF